MTARDPLTPARLSDLSRRWIAGGAISVVVVTVLSVSIGPASIAPGRAALAILNLLPMIDLDSGLTPVHESIVTVIRLPRAVLGLLVGSLLAQTGAAYQGAFRNPLADPYLLGVAAGAGLGATIAIVSDVGDGAGWVDPVPLAAFVGALIAVVMAFAAGNLGGRSPVSLVLAGVAVASFLTACQTYVLQNNTDIIQEVYAWILGRLNTAGWSEVRLLLPYFALTSIVLWRYRGALDVMAVGDEEAASLGVNPRRVRGVIIVVASLGAAAAVAVSGLIGFVGMIVPHAVRLTAGVSNRVVLPLSMLLGASFMAATDLLARTVISPAELPIGVVTAFLGAPFFVVVLRTSRREVW